MIGQPILASWHQPRERSRDLHGVGGRSLAQVVGDHPKVQAVRHRRIAANAADEDLVAAGCSQRQRHFALGEVVQQHDARRTPQGFARLLDADGAVELQVDRLGMADADRHAGRRRRDLDGIVAHDLAGFADHLPLFFGVAFLAAPSSRAAGRCRRAGRHGPFAAGTVSPRPRAAIWASSSNRPVAPLPEDAW